ncbi:MAG: metallophosphoesterase family protein [Gemmatimonadetes bacterium]|nr:metallophosphoesterase family protein [Gemmatimonadota bacterium]
MPSEPDVRGPLAVFGGVYSNHLALEAAVADARRREARELYCLGDLGGFGPNPDKIFPLLLDAGVEVVRGNYDDSIARALGDCQCGYTDPRDNAFARISYDYSLTRTSPRWRAWMNELPSKIRVRAGGHRVLMCHGSPRRTNEFLWDSTSSTQFLDRLARAQDADVVMVTHTGLPWVRELPGGGLFVNVGVLGRPANDGGTAVRYALLTVDEGSPAVEVVSLTYDHEQLAHEMRAERLPEEFVETILTGWWTTCLEILPAKERARGRF